MNNNGWIKIHRKIMDNCIYKDAHLLHLFIHCLLKANHKANKFLFNDKEMIIERGQFITGRLQLAEDLNVNSSLVYRKLKILENLKIVNIKSNNKFSLVTVLKYNTYQDLITTNEQQNEQQANNQRTTNEQQANTNKKDKNDNKEKKIKIIDSANIPLVNLKNNIQNNTEYTTEELFEYIWQEYPKRDGKKSSLRNFNATIKNENDFLDLCKSVNNYLHTDTVRKGYIKNGSTFFNNWKDFIEPSTNGFHKIKDDLEPEKF